MGDKRLYIFKYFFPLSRLFYVKFNHHIQRFHTLPQRVISLDIVCDLRKTKNLFRYNKKNNSLNKHLYDCFMRNEELTSYVVDMIICASNKAFCSTDLIYFMVKTFDDYIVQHNIQFCPTLIQKTEVLLSTLCSKNYQLIQLVCNVFKIKEQTESFKDIIEDLIWQQKLIEAAYCVSAFHLQKEFPVEKILLPLLLEGKVHPTAIYMTNLPDLQLKAAQFMDNYLNPKDSSSYANTRKIFKTLTTVLNMFKIPIVHCPNLLLIRSKGAINILVNRRMKQSVLESTWEDMLMGIIGENEYLKIFLIKKLVLKKDMKTALKMVKKFNIKHPDLSFPEMSGETIENDFDINDVKTEDFDILSDLDKDLENGDNSVNHLEFSLKAEDIKVVANEKDFVDCINEISENYTMIGIDSEWKPNFGLSKDRLSLIQIAVHDKVFIFDILLLSKYLEVSHWDKFLDDIFGNPNLIKLGCGITADVNMILESIKGTKGKTIKFSHILDMALFYQKLQDVYPEKIESEKNKAFTKGLSSLCDIILGKPLNKEERLCDWEKRPLKESQLEYAALDAHCLLQMYDQLREDSIKKDINFDHLAKVAIVMTTSQWKPKRRFKGVKSDIAFHIHSQIPIKQFKVIVDSVLESQGKELRQFGADVIILKETDSPDFIAKISNIEERIVICSERLWNQVKDKVKEGFCHCFPSNDDPIKVSHFLQHFNVQVSAKCIYTRCIVCNSKDGVKLVSEDVKFLYNLKKTNISFINSIIKDNLSSFSSEMQDHLKDILTSDVNVKFAQFNNTSYTNECAFLCKKCGCIS